ncbi:PREDICTED: alpha-protein kinase 2-like, partial [Galeopterus variegatus]|uniref:Alpha-protein kinase 2-like n=1 Tax=Galeopterus variegatus TaxID=482537 RepID=A0ABM0SJ95_GALVR
NGIDKKEHPFKEADSVSPGAPTPSDSCAPKFNCLRSLQVSASNDTSAASSEAPSDVNGTKQTEQAEDPNTTEETAAGLLLLHSSNTPEKQDVCHHRPAHSKVPRLVDGGLSNDSPNDEALNSSHQIPKVQKYISFSQPLSEATACISPGDSATVNKQLGPQVSSKDTDSDYELCPEITLTYMEEFSDDDLEYLECSDVMTDYTNAVWQRNLQGTEHVFLLESDDEEKEFSEHGLGGCGHFLSEMGCGPRVSDDTGSMGATTGFCGYHSQPQEVGTRNSRACMHGPLSPQTGMTLTLGPHQDGTSTVTEQGRYKLPASSEAAENDYPGIQGDRDSHQAGEEFSSDHLLNMDKAATETQRKPLSGELEKSGMNQCWEMAEKRGGEKGLWSKRGLQTPARGRRPGIKGKPKKLNANLKESATAGSLNLLRPKGPAKHPLTRSGERETPHAKAGAADWNSHFHAGECAPSTQAEQEVETLQTPTDSLPKAGDAGFKGEGMQVNTLFETSQFPDPGNRPQVQIQEMVRERTCLSQMPAFSEPAGEESSFIGTTTNSFPNSGGTHEEHASLARYLEVESCTQDPQHEKRQDREHNTPSHWWEDLEHELSIPEAKCGILSPGGLFAHLPQDASAGHRDPEALSVASTEHTDPALTLQNVCDGPRGREVACVMECFEAGDQGACCDATGPRVAAPVDKYLPQEICSTDFALAGGQSRAKYLAVSIAENNHADGAEESSPQAPEENIVQFPSNVQLGHILSGPTTKPTEDPLCMASSVPRAHGHVPQLPEGESFCSDSPLQIDSQTGDESQTRDRAVNRSLKEHFQEKRSETKQRIQQRSLSHQGSLSADDSQESVPTTSPAQEEMNWVPLEHSPANSREERGQSSGLGMSVSMVDEDSQGLSNVSSLSSVLLEESKENGLGHQEAGNKLKIVTLEAPVSEIWPPRELTHSECKELEAGPIVPDRVWAVPDVLKADTAVPELDASGGATLAHSPQHESDSALANNREIHEGEELGRRAHWSSLSSRYLSQPRFLESSVDPIDEKALCVADPLPEASKTGRKEDVNNVSRGQGENQLEVDHPGFFKQFLTCPKILESSVDPIDETSLIECTRAGQQVPSERTQGVIGEGSKLNDGNLGRRVEVQPAVLQVPEETIPSENRINRNQEDSERGAAKQSQHGEAEVDAHPAIWQVPCADGGRERTPGGCGINRTREGTGRSLAEQSKKDKAEFTFPTSPLPSCLAMTTPASVVVDTHNSTGWIHDISENDLVEPLHRQDVFSDSKERGTMENECGKHLTSSSDLTRLPSTSSLKRNSTRISISHEVEEPKTEEPEIGEAKLPSSSVSPTMTLAFISGECESEKAPRLLQDLCQKGTLGCVKKPREKDRLSHLAAQMGKLPEAQPAVTGSEEVKKKQETSGSGHLTEGVKKKILSRVAALRLRLEEKENVRENSSFLKKIPKLETSLSCPDEKKDSKKSPCKREGK